MYKIVIVEDEMGERELLCKIIDEVLSDFTVVTSFGNGLDALDYLAKHHTDVLITDIKMPQMGGLDLISQLRKNNDKMKFIVLSGYSDFEYAKKSITYGVTGYLTKPLDVTELCDTFNRIKTALDQEYSSAADNSSEIQREFFLDLCMSAIDDSNELYARYSELNLPFSVTDAYGFIIKINLKDYERNHLHNEEISARSLTNILKEFFGEYVYYFYLRDDEFYFFVLNRKPDLLDNIQKELSSALNCSINLTLISQFASLDKAECDIFTLTDKIELLISHKLFNKKSICKKLSQSIMSNISSDGKINIQSINAEISSLFGLDSIDALLSKNFNIKNCSENNIIKFVEEYIENNYSTDISRDDIAHHVYMNPSYFSRFFKKQMGVGFYEYLLDFRFSKALELMKTNMSIEKIAEKTGFRNSKNFRRTFKLKTSYTPQEYRNKLSD